MYMRLLLGSLPLAIFFLIWLVSSFVDLQLAVGSWDMRVSHKFDVHMLTLRYVIIMPNYKSELFCI